MIKNNESIVEITSRNLKYYKDRLYECKIGDTITIDVLTMPKMSHNKVIAICEICNSENELSFSKYNKNISRQGYYSCRKCSRIKRSISMVKKYGVENISQTDENREKMRKWMSSKEFRKISENTQISKHGSLYVQTDKFKEFISDLHIERIKNLKEKGEYISTLSNPENVILLKNGMYRKYGEYHPHLVQSIKEKIQKTNLEKFGHISPFGNSDISEKAKKTMIEKYGVDNPFKSDEIQDKIREKILEKYNNMDISKFNSYKRKVKYLTSKLKNKLFEEWDGNDYYDKEYILDNIKNYNRNHANYPTIDHKFSSFYGFINGILPEKISEISNLCITKRFINSIKSELSENEFINQFKFIKSRYTF